MYKCEFCKKEYINKSVLNKHQKTTKKCLELQNLNLHLTNKCDNCNYSTNRTDYYKLHLQTCKHKITKTSCELTNKYNNMNENYEKLNVECIKIKNEFDKLNKKYTNITIQKNNIKMKYIEVQKENTRLILENQLHLNTIKMLENQVSVSHRFLQDNINTIISKPSIQQQENNLTNHNNQKIDLSLNLNSDFIQKNVDDNFTLHHLLNGIKGVATFTNDFIVHKENGQSKYICTDSSRAVFKYKDENGMIQKDIKATKLKNNVKNPIITKSKQLYESESSRLLNDSCTDHKSDVSTLNRINIGMLTDQFLKIKNIDDHVEEYAKEMILALT